MGNPTGTQVCECIRPITHSNIPLKTNPHYTTAYYSSNASNFSVDNKEILRSLRYISLDLINQTVVPPHTKSSEIIHINMRNQIQIQNA